MQACKRSMCNWQDLHACGNLLIDLAGTSHLLSERWLLESSQYQYGNAPIRLLLAVDAWLQPFVALCPARSGPMGRGKRRSVLDAEASRLAQAVL